MEDKALEWETVFEDFRERKHENLVIFVVTFGNTFTPHSSNELEF